MAVRTQQMGVNPGTEVTCSHAPTSREARARAESTHPSQGERSNSWNIFRGLGRGTDLWDTLNQMRDQERSQQSIAQNRQPRLAPMGQGEIPIEDFHHFIATMKENDVEFIAVAIGLPFT